MATVYLPQLGPGFTSATVVRWLKRPGDHFVLGEPLVELEADDALVVVEANLAGQLGELMAELGTTVRVGDALARIELGEIELGAVEKKFESSEAEEKAIPAGKVVPILMPQAGNTMEEGTVVVWHVREGDRIAVGQTICEIETDKATMEFQSPDAGRLARIIAAIGEPVAVKRPIALLAESDAEAETWLRQQGAGGREQGAGTVLRRSPVVRESPDAALAKTAGVTTSGARPIPSADVSTGPFVAASGRVKASPAARRLAGERGIALESLGNGSGPGGRILSTDLEQVAGTADVVVRRPLSRMRRAIGLNLQRSKQTVPHFYVRTTIDAGPLLALYRDRKTADGCTLNDIIVLAVGRAIRDFPAVRSQIVDDQVVEHPHANIGIAVGVDEGLVVPVVLAVDTLSLAALAAETKRIVGNARRGKLDNIGSGHFTISNLGMFGVEEFSAIINPPESGILAVGAAREAVIVENGTMRAGHTMTMTLSADHRLVDGVMAAQFMQRLRQILERPAEELA